LAVFSDALDRVDGVSSWCSRFTTQAAASGRRVWFATCDPADHVSHENALPRPYPAVARFVPPFYPDFEITVPSLAATIDRLWREGITHVEIATPGPMGLVGLAAARLLRLPVTASYHTDFAELVQVLVGDPKLAQLARAYLGWFYRSVDRVFAFSAASQEKLVAMGVPPERIDAMPVAVDPEDFSPARSSATAFSSLGLELGERPVVLSVGRISAEKNVPSIIDAVAELKDRQPAPFLVVVGDGPALADLKDSCRDKSFVAFVGAREGEVLRKLYASADVFVFASQVDTLGLVNLEALSSGVPVLVPHGSAITESLRDGHNALFFSPRPGGLKDVLRSVLDDPAGAARLAGNGRQHMLDRWEDAQFDAVWQIMTGAPTSPAMV
jgi:glycosyltransferase involved in cell wall biosynthesis